LLAVVNDSTSIVVLRDVAVEKDRATTTAYSSVGAPVLAWRTTTTPTNGTSLAVVGAGLPSGIDVLGATASDAGALTGLTPDAPAGGDAAAGQVMSNRIPSMYGQFLMDTVRPLRTHVGDFALRPGERLIVGLAAVSGVAWSNPTTNRYVVNVAFDTVTPLALTSNDAAHAHTAASPALTQTFVFTPNGAQHEHTAASPALVTPYPVDQAAHVHAAGEPALRHLSEWSDPATVYVLTPDEASHAHAADAPAITQHHLLAADDATHAHTASSPTLATRVILPDPDQTSHGHTAGESLVRHLSEWSDPGGGTTDTAYLLVSVDARHTHTASAPTLALRVALTANGAAHSHTASSPAAAVTVPLVPQDASHNHTAAAPALTQTHELTASGAAHGHTASSPAITQLHLLGPDSTSHATTASSPAADQVNALNANDSQHGHTASSPAISQLHLLEPDGATHQVVSDTPAIVQAHQLAADGTTHGHTVSTPAITQVHQLAPDNTTHGHTAGAPPLTFTSLAPTLIHPEDDALWAGTPFDWDFNPGGGGDTQTEFAFRRTFNGVDEWWDGSEWVDTETFLVSGDIVDVPGRGVDMSVCDGTTPEPCCYVNGQLCRFLRDDGPEAARRWVCKLRERYGNWTDVHADPGYLEHVKPAWAANGIADCGDYPAAGVTCGECGKVGQ
jgi:hypothetical protein